ncbi:hypothetical protein AVEN_59286-1, partial [Araneus ventricosus]
MERISLRSKATNLSESTSSASPAAESGPAEGELLLMGKAIRWLRSILKVMKEMIGFVRKEYDRRYGRITY